MINGMRRLTPTVAPSVMIAIIAGYGLAADRRGTAVPEGDLKNLPVVRDIVTSANDVFAVGDMEREKVPSEKRFQEPLSGLADQ